MSDIHPHIALLHPFKSFEEFLDACDDVPMLQKAGKRERILFRETAKQIWKALLESMPNGVDLDLTQDPEKFSEEIKTLLTSGGIYPVIHSMLSYLPAMARYAAMNQERDVMANAFNDICELLMRLFPEGHFPDQRVYTLVKGIQKIMRDITAKVSHPMFHDEEGPCICPACAAKKTRPKNGKFPKVTKEKGPGYTMTSVPVKVDDDGKIINTADMPPEILAAAQEALDGEQDPAVMKQVNKVELCLDPTKPETWEAAIDALPMDVPDKVKREMLKHLHKNYAEGKITPEMDGTTTQHNFLHIDKKKLNGDGDVGIDRPGRPELN